MKMNKLKRVHHRSNDKEWENTFNYSENKFYFEYNLKEIGTLTMLGFEKINGQWNLTLYIKNDC